MWKNVRRKQFTRLGNQNQDNWRREAKWAKNAGENSAQWSLTLCKLVIHCFEDNNLPNDMMRLKGSINASFEQVQPEQNSHLHVICSFL